MDENSLFALVCKVADLAFEYASPEVMSDLWLEDRRGEEVNPFYSQTESGIFLELYYGQPGSIWTPWGKWNCWGSGAGYWDEVMPEFLQRLGAVEHTPLSRTSMGEFGPVYKLTCVDGIALPDAVKREQDAYLDYKDAKEAWSKLKDRNSRV